MALVNPNIAMSFRQPEFQAPNALAQYAQIQQIQGGRQAQELNALKMQEAQAALEERNALRQLNPSAEDYENQLFKVNPQLGIQFRKERSAADASAAATAASKASAQSSQATAAAARKKIADQARRDISSRPSDANITAHMEDVLESDLFNEQEKAAVTRYTARLLSIPLAERGAYLASQGATAGELKPSVQQINQGGQTQVLRVPAFGGAPTAVGTFADVPLPAAVEAQKSRIGKAGASQQVVNVSTEKKYGERFGGLIADQDAAKLSAAENAPQAAATADRVMDLISSGKVITGTGANARLQLAKALNLAGGTDSEKIRNTEVLVSSLAETTLGAIKSSNLGAGQGFTNADRDFLEKAKAGQLSYDAKSLTELARLSRLAAEKSADSWNTRVKQIPASALQGTGISTNPVVVPPRKTSSVMNIPSAAIDMLKSGAGTREQFDAQFGPGSADRVLPKGK
jgi:hypothetical protein